jgi:hypothetical protein
LNLVQVTAPSNAGRGLHQRGKHLARVALQRLGDPKQFQQVNPPLSPLACRDEGLRFLEAVGYLIVAGQFYSLAAVAGTGYPGCCSSILFLHDISDELVHR